MLAKRSANPPRCVAIIGCLMDLAGGVVGTGGRKVSEGRGRGMRDMHGK